MRKKTNNNKKKHGVVVNTNLNDIMSRRKMLFHEMFNHNIIGIDKMIETQTEPMEIHNKLVDVRNQCVDFISDSLSEITALVKHKAIINIGTKKQKVYPVKEYDTPCQICGEKRVINYCHIIPSVDGGGDDDRNLLILCPTHHFLFDHARLSKSELDKIDLSVMHDEAKQYFISVHKKRHNLRWKYLTNRFPGCDCGSDNFSFEPYRDYSVVNSSVR